MHICIATSYDLSRDGGVLRHILGLATVLRQQGHRVAVIGPYSCRQQLPKGCFGFPGVVAVPANRSIAHIGATVSAKAVLSFVAKQNFDLIHTHEPLVFGPARIVLQNPAPKVATFHAYNENDFWLSRSWRWLASRPLQNIRAGIAVSQVAAKFAQPIFQKPLTVIPNGLTTQLFASPSVTPSSEVLDNEPLGTILAKPLRVLFCGRFNESRKGLPFLLNAVAHLRQHGFAITLTVVGAGSRRWRYNLPIRGVHFAGRLSDQDLIQAYHSHHVFCAPSTGSESFGLVLIEAMAAGLVVIASSIDGYREAAQNSVYWVPPCQSQALVAAFRVLGSQPALRRILRAQGLLRAQALDWQQLAFQILNIYRSVHGHR